MKPTQQEIIELARELRRIANPNESRIYQHERGKLFEAARMLERFGAGGGEPFAKVESALAYCTGFHARLIPGSRMPKVGTVLYTHPSPTSDGNPTGYLVGHSGEYHYFRHKADAEREKAEQERCSGESCGDVEPVFRHPSSTDLRAEYLRGLEDAKKIANNYGPSRPIVTKTPSQRIVGRWEGEQAASAGIADAIEALKGKQ